MTPDSDRTGEWRRTRLARARLYLVAPVTIGDAPLAEVLPRILAAGVDIVQLRDKDADEASLFAAGKAAQAACAAAGALFVVNDRADLALALDADGVHIGQGDGPVAAARATVGDDRLVGRSTNEAAHLASASADGADYAGVGPVYATPTKAGRDAVGLAYVRTAAAVANLPWFAIGGIDETCVGEVTAAGATRIAVVRAITSADDPAAATRALRHALR